MQRVELPILDLAPEINAHWDEFMGAIESVLRSGQFIMGPNVAAFETEVAAYLGVKHAIGMNSGTDALYIALRALSIGPGDEVITTPFTFFATAEAISHVGATPVFVDIDPTTYNIDPNQVEQAITSKTKAIIPVHLFGHAADLDPLLELAKLHDLALIEDVAQAFGGEYKGRRVGTFGSVGTFSFFPSKNLGAFGDGGMLTTNDSRIAEEARMLRSHGSKKKYYNEVVGYNSRLDELQAAILRVKLTHIEEVNAGRRRVARIYNELLRPISNVVTPFEAAYATHVYHQYTIRVEGVSRNELQQALATRGVNTMVYYPVPCHKLPVYSNTQFHLPVSEAAAEQVISLPIWPQMSPEQQVMVADALAESLR